MILEFRLFESSATIRRRPVPVPRPSESWLVRDGDVELMFAESRTRGHGRAGPHRLLSLLRLQAEWR